MTIRAAGILFLTDAGDVLLLKRGPGGDWPGAWCFPGGTAEDGETAEQTACREAVEELGALPDGVRELWTRRIATDAAAFDPAQPPGALPPAEVDFTTFLQRVPDKFEPALNGEHTGFAWVKPTEPPLPLHPGAAVALARFGMDELGVARAMVAGDLTSPQRYVNVWLYAMRITGTGVSYRSAINEVVFRPPEIYINPDFLARCNGLPVIWQHPPKSSLDSDEFAKRVVGSIFLPYIHGDEVWGIAKIYDESAHKAMQDGQLSTSPSVILNPLGDNANVKLEDGNSLLVEGVPMLLDHLAICDVGVWDKGGPPAGVISTNGDQSMTEAEMAADKARKDAEDKARMDAEAKEREDKARRDAAGGVDIDKVLKGIDKVCDSVDKLNARMDAMEKRYADARKDAKHDGEGTGEIEGKGEPKELAADKARKDAEAKEAKEREDKARRDAEIKKIADSIAAMPKATSDADYEAMADAQERADAAFQALGMRAPGPMQGEDLHGFRVRLARTLQRHSATWKDADLRTLDDKVLSIAEGGIYADAITASRSPDVLPEGELVKRERRGPAGHLITEWLGRPGSSIFRAHSTPALAVTAFNTGMKG